jgi:hypothetical protein
MYLLSKAFRAPLVSTQPPIQLVAGHCPRRRQADLSFTSSTEVNNECRCTYVPPWSALPIVPRRSTPMFLTGLVVITGRLPTGPDNGNT